MELVPFHGYFLPTKMNATAWVNEWFMLQQLILSPSCEKPFDGLDKMLLYSWVREQFSGSEDQSFVLNYWDLRLQNKFLADILRLGCTLPDLRFHHPDLLAEALYRSPERLAIAASDWKAFNYSLSG